MGKLIFITGGARSGKSSLAVQLAGASPKDKVFLATCIAEDEEMRERVRRHRADRPKEWRTVEPGLDVIPAFQKETQADVLIIIDCLTLFVSLMLLRGDGEAVITGAVHTLVDVVKKGRATVILVSNEVGSGLVPENKLGRDFRDLAGMCNQIAATGADEVYWTVSGIPVKIKGDH